MATPSFADVCVGAKVRVIGTGSTSDVVTASQVTVGATPSPAGLGHGRIGERLEHLWAVGRGR